MKDAEWIATCRLKDLLKGSYVPEDLIQQLRQYDWRISDLNAECVRKLDKLDAALLRCDIRISNYVSTTGGKSHKEVVRLVSEGILYPAELVKVIHGRIVNRVGKGVVLASLTGVISNTDIDVIRQLREEVELAEKHKDECQSKMDAICQQEPSDHTGNQGTFGYCNNLRSGHRYVIVRRCRHLVSWCGLKPRNEESAGKIKARSTTHGNKYLRKTLIECAWAASRTQGCYFNKFSYHQVVVRRKILSICLTTR